MLGRRYELTQYSEVNGSHCHPSEGTHPESTEKVLPLENASRTREY